MQPLDSSLRKKNPPKKTKVTTSVEDGIEKDFLVLPQEALSYESVEEVRPVRLVTWNVEEKPSASDEEETLSMLGKRKLKEKNKKVLAEKMKEEKDSWKLWWWAQGCPCWGWSPMYVFNGNDDNTSKGDQSSVATSTFVTRDEDDEEGDDNSSIPSCSRVGSTLDESIVVVDEHVSDVSSNSRDGILDLEINEEAADVVQTTPPPLAKSVEANIVKDWSREGLSKNTIIDMDVYMNAMRS